MRSFLRRPFLVAAVAVGVFTLGCQPSRVLVGPGLQPVLASSVTTTTKDGWALAIRRFRAETLDPTKAPVILCHGLNCNDRFWDVARGTSFAQYLAARGYDVWVPALRGAGSSTKPGIVVVRRLIRPVFPELPKQISFRMIDPRALNWTMDSYVKQDVPAILKAVRKETGAHSVHWVGHSMGGMIILAYVELYGDDGLATITALGSPMTIPQPPNNFLAAFKQNKELYKLATLVVNASVPASLHVIDERSGMAGALYNPQNMSSSVTREFFTRGVEDIPIGVLDQLVGAVQTGEVRSADGKVNYAKLLDRVTVPSFIAGGMVDHVAPPESVRFVYNHIGSQDKRFHIFAVVNNDAVDYGHLDLVLGRHAPSDVYPAVEGWLASHPVLKKRGGPSPKASP